MSFRWAAARMAVATITTAIAWSAAATTGVRGIEAGFATLFFGGMLIFPISAGIVRYVVGRPPPGSENTGGVTVMETVVPMIGGLFAAWLIMPYRPEFVFPLASLAVGAHYFGFQTAYGDRTYWVLGGIMCIVGCTSIILQQPVHYVVPYLVAGIEIGFGLWLTAIGLQERQDSPATTSASGQQHAA